MTDVPSSSLYNIKDNLGVELPIKTIRDFLLFEEEVAAIEERTKELW